MENYKVEPRTNIMKINQTNGEYSKTAHFHVILNKTIEFGDLKNTKIL